MIRWMRGFTRDVGFLFELAFRDRGSEYEDEVEGLVKVKEAKVKKVIGRTFTSKELYLSKVHDYILYSLIKRSETTNAASTSHTSQTRSQLDLKFCLDRCIVS